jgi:hypothetical protein
MYCRGISPPPSKEKFWVCLWTLIHFCSKLSWQNAETFILGAFRTFQRWFLKRSRNALHESTCVERRVSHQDKHTFLLALSPSDCQHRHVSTLVRPAVSLFIWKNMTPRGRTFVEFCTCELLLRPVKEIQFWLNLTDTTDTRLMKIYDISPFFPWVEQKLPKHCAENQTRKTRFTVPPQICFGQYNSLFKGLLCCLSLSGLQINISFGILLLFILVTCRRQFDLYLLSF